jgi:hypothetical protein
MRLKDWGKGLNLDQPPWELAPGYWSAGQNIRFRAGKAQRVGGIASSLTPSITPYFILPYSSGATRYALYAGLTKAYVHDGTTETEITRTSTSAPATVSSASVSAGTLTIQTSTNHGLATNDIVTTYGFMPTTFNKTNKTITVTDATHFTISGIPGSGSATTIGGYSVVYQAAASVTNFTGAVDDKWTGGNYNGVAWINSPVDGFFYWDQTVTGKLHSFADSTLTKADAARSFKNFMFFLAPTTGGTKYLHRVMWSASADPGTVPTTVTAAATNDAGSQDLVSDGKMVDSLEWGDVLYIYKQDKRFSARYIGGQYVFDLQLVTGNHKDDGLLAQNCVVNTPKGQVFFTDGHDIRIHTGGESQSLAIGRVLDYVKSNIDTTYRKRAFLCVNPPFNEVWICYPKTGSTTCNEALIWNWEDDTWGIRTLTNVTHASSGEYPTTIANDARLLVCNTTPKIGLADSGYTDFGSTITTYGERTGLDLESPGFKMISRSMPRFDGSTNFTASIYHGASKTQDASPTYSSASTYTHNTTSWVHSFSGSGRYLAFKWSTTASDTPSLISVDFDIKTQGQY